MQKKNCSVSVILSKMPHFIETVLLYCFEKFDVNRFQIDISVYKQSYTMLDLWLWRALNIDPILLWYKW